MRNRTWIVIRLGFYATVRKYVFQVKILMGLHGHVLGYTVHIWYFMRVI